MADAASPSAGSANGRTTICFDLDGTLCTNTFGSYEEAEPYWWAIERVGDLARASHHIIILTARGTATGIDWREVTEAQLARWEVPHDGLFFGKPSADVYVDDRAVHTSAWRLGDSLGVPGFGPRPREELSLPETLPPSVAATIEVGRTFAGRPLRLEAHAARARETARAAGVRPLPAVEQIVRTVRDVLPGGGGQGDVVYAICLSPGGHAAYPDAWTGSPGPRVQVSGRWLRDAVEGLRPFATDPDEPDSVRASIGAAHRDAWPLGGDEGGVVSDLADARVVSVTGGRLQLGAGSPLPDLATAWLEELAGGLGLELAEGPVSRAQLLSADEAFLAGLPFCILGLASVDGRTLGDSAPGQITLRLLDAWSEQAGVDIAGQRRRMAAG